MAESNDIYIAGIEQFHAKYVCNEV